MAAETVTPDIQAALSLLQRARPSTATDNLVRAGESGAPTTRTTTIVETLGANPSETTITMNLTVT
jgi:hypothetical protein